MLLHLVPRLFACRLSEPECALIDFHCPALGLVLKGGVDIVARRPWPNKSYLVACRKVGRKAMNGFLVETTERVREFTTITRWAVGADRIVNHQVQYFVLDDDFGAITEDMGLWYATSDGWPSRWPTIANDWTPLAAQPRMELTSRERKGSYADRTDSRNRIIERAEVFQMHTIERERIEHYMKHRLSERIPAAETAFRATIQPYNHDI